MATIVNSQLDTFDRILLVLYAANKAGVTIRLNQLGAILWLLDNGKVLRFGDIFTIKDPWPACPKQEYYIISGQAGNKIIIRIKNGSAHLIITQEGENQLAAKGALSATNQKTIDTLIRALKRYATMTNEELKKTIQRKIQF